MPRMQLIFGMLWTEKDVLYAMGCNLPLKLHFLHCRLDLFTEKNNIGQVSEKHNQGFTKKSQTESSLEEIGVRIYGRFT